MKKSVAAMLAVCLLLTGCKKTDAVAQYLAEGIAQQIAWMDDIPFTDGPDMGGYDDIGSNWTAPQTESGVPGPVYDEIYKEIESGNYRQAQSKLEAAINRYGNDDHFAELSEMLHAVGGITRNNTAGAFVENCSVSMTTDGCTFVGGVAEYQSGTVSDCTAALQINGVTCLGGISYANAGKIQNCTANGTVHTDHTNGYLAALVGENLKTGTISGSTATVKNDVRGTILPLVGNQ